jgi:dipeptidyl aminopeptidase/acylaminoacyl peptidase
LRLGGVTVDGDDIYWLEGRPAEGGRTVLVRRSRDGQIADVTPPPFYVRTRVHEYGGGAYVVDRGEIYFSNFADQRIYRVDAARTFMVRETGAIAPVTPEGPWFYADAIVDRARQRLICVREDHSRDPQEPENTLVAIDLAGDPNAGEVIARGYDFYSTPRLSPDGRTLSWLCWRHPQMPWDGTELWIADVSAAGTLENHRLIAGGERESIFQPGWSSEGDLIFASDRDGWWRLHIVRDLQTVRTVPVLHEPPAESEFGLPQWVFGTATWAAAGPGRLVASYAQRGIWHLAAVDVRAGTLTDLATLLQPRDWLTATTTHAVFVGTSPTQSDAVTMVELATGRAETLRAASTLSLDSSYVSVPEAIEFQTAEGRSAHAFYYPPRHGDCTAPEGERPPLIVISHGGPTTATVAMLDLRIQFWTTRGFGVVDVNYSGSSGYGRQYRERLNGRWGIVDVDDVVHAARHLVEQARADPDRLIIRGGSAGGYTTLAALTFKPDVFEAGASYYGVSDLEVLARDTHKFEARYLDTLIGPYPELREIYRARSPIHFVDRLACALILFQGLEDRIVPPNQSEMMAAAVREKGLPVAYVAFEGEQHGFRKADTIVRSLEAELFFYGQVFGFEPADRIEPLQIDNLERARSR